MSLREVKEAMSPRTVPCCRTTAVMCVGSPTAGCSLQALSPPPAQPPFIAFSHPAPPRGPQLLPTLTRWHVGPGAFCGHVWGHEARLWRLIRGGSKFRRRDGSPLGLHHGWGDAI